MLRLLGAQGIDLIFGLSGNGVLGLFDAAVDEGFRIIDVRDEGAGVQAAGARAMVSRHPQVCLVTEGPGITNALGAIAAMHHDGVPVIILTNYETDGIFPTRLFQEMPQVEMTRPLCKWSTNVAAAEHLAPAIARAFRVASSGVPGPVVLNIANKVLLSRPGGNGQRTAVPETISPAFPAPGFVEDAIRRLREAKRPLLVAGSLVGWGRADAALARLVELTGAPVVTADQARGILDEEHPCSMGNLRTGLAPSARKADLVMVLGERIDNVLADGRYWESGTDFIHVYPEAAEIAATVRPVLATTADTRSVLEALVEAARGLRWDHGAWTRSARRDFETTRARYRAFDDTEGEGIHPAIVARTVAEVAGSSSTFVIDGANCANWARAWLSVPARNRFLEWGRLGMIGSGLPYALGAQSLDPDGPVVLLVGDGSLGFHFMELETAVRHALPVVIVVFNDSAWGIEQHFQRGVFGRQAGTALTHVRFDRMAQAVGASGDYVRHEGELEAALRRALDCGRPALINVKVLDVPDLVTRRATKMLARKFGGEPQ